MYSATTIEVYRRSKPKDSLEVRGAYLSSNEALEHFAFGTSQADRGCIDVVTFAFRYVKPYAVGIVRIDV